MKKILAIALVCAFSFIVVNPASAQQKKTMTADALMQTLEQVNTQNGVLNIGNVPVTVSNIKAQDLVTVQSILNNAEIDILNNSLNNNDVDVNALNDLLRNAKLLNKNQVVVGILSDQDRIRYVVHNLRAAK